MCAWGDVSGSINGKDVTRGYVQVRANVEVVFELETAIRLLAMDAAFVAAIHLPSCERAVRQIQRDRRLQYDASMYAAQLLEPVLRRTTT